MHRIRRRRRHVNGRFVASAVVAGLLCRRPPSRAARIWQTAAGAAGYGLPSPAAATAIAFARAQLGKPYLWGGTGPDAFDCSGLVMMAYQAAGVTIPAPRKTSGRTCRTYPARSPVTWCSSPAADGTWSAPGHVALVISAAR